MTLDNFIVGIQEQLGFRTDLRDTIVREGIDTKETLELDSRLYPIKFLPQRKVNTEVSASFSTLNFDDFLYIDEARGYIWRQDEGGTWTKLEQVDPADEQLGAEGPPVAYYIEESTVVILPMPDQAYTLQVKYTARTGRALADGDVWLRYAGRLLQAETGFLMASKVGHDRAVQAFTGQIQNERIRLLASNINDDGHERVMS